MALFLITGGCGFIGSHLADALIACGHRVRILDDLSTGKLANAPADAEIIRGDVADPASVARAIHEVDGCFHLAAVASVERGNEDWLGTHRTNLTGAITIFNAARSARADGRAAPVVYASSAAVYGSNQSVPLREDAQTVPLSAYGADKLGCEQHAFVASHVHGVPTCGLRFFNVYGPRQDPRSPYSGVISIFCDRLASGQDIDIHGDGQQTRDFIFVTDVVRALMLAMQHASLDASVFNVCTGRPTSILDLGRTIASLVAGPGELRSGAARRADVKTSLGDPRKAEEKLGFIATTGLETGLAAVLRPAARAPQREACEVVSSSGAMMDLGTTTLAAK